MPIKLKIVITGGSGFIGSRLTPMLLAKGYRVEHLARNANSRSGVKTRLWNIGKGKIEEGVFELLPNEQLVIIHLAGEGIADKKWTVERKSTIISSRTSTIDFLFQQLVKRNIVPYAVLSASGSGYYGAITTEKIFSEKDNPHTDFIAHSCIEWEKSVNAFQSLCSTVILRIPFILDGTEGGLPKLARPVEFGIGMALGKGDQWIPWAHWKDVCNAFIFALENKLSGVYNVSAPTHITNKGLTKALCKQFHMPYILPSLPAFLLRLFLGEMAVLVLEGSRVDGSKLRDSGFTFEYQTVESALKAIYGK